MQKLKPVIVDFKDNDLNYECVVTKDNSKLTMTKEKFMLQLIKYKEKSVVCIKEDYQIFKSINLLFLTVYKFIIIFSDNSKIIVKNVLDTDIYLPELEAMTGYRAKIHLNRDDNYPDFPKKSDGKYVDKLYIKKYKRY